MEKKLTWKSGAFVLNLLSSALCFADAPEKILQDLYENATVAAKWDDFENYSTLSSSYPKQICTMMVGQYNSETGELGPQTPSYYPLHLFVKSIPDWGPLLPGASREKVIPDDWQQQFDSIVQGTGITELTALNPEWRTMQDPQTGKSYPIQRKLEMRKSGVYVALKETTFWDWSKGPGQFVTYGYCYPFPASLF